MTGAAIRCHSARGAGSAASAARLVLSTSACAMPSASTAAATGSTLYTLRSGAATPFSSWSTGWWNRPPSGPG